MKNSHPNESVGVAHCRKLLVQYLTGPLTDEQAAKKARLHTVDTCYWKRGTDLRKAGLIQWLTTTDGCKVKRKSQTTGRNRGVCELTAKGHRIAKILKAKPLAPFSL